MSGQTARDVMDPNPTVLAATDTIGTGIGYIMEKRFRNVPIVDAEGRYLGVFGVNCLLRLVLPQAALMEQGLTDLSFVSDSLKDLRRHLKASEDKPVTICLSDEATVIAPDTPLLETLLVLLPDPPQRAGGRSARIVACWASSPIGTSARPSWPRRSKMHADAAPSLIFGLDPLWFATAVFAATYVLVMTERINRAIVAMLAAGVMVLAGVLTQQQAVAGVDFNTLGLLTGMMVIVAITRKSGVFQYLAVWSAKKVNADPWGILVMLALVTAVLSAFLDNVTTVLLVAPVTLLITETLKVSPYPYLFAEIFASNIGGTATLIGDPPNIMIGSAVGYTFNDFVIHLAPVVVVIMAATLVPIYFIWGRKPQRGRRGPAASHGVRRARGHHRPAGPGPVAVGACGLVILGFIVAHTLGQEPSTIALFGAAVLLLLDNYPRTAEAQTHAVHSALTEVEWVTLFFFLGLFIVVHGLERHRGPDADGAATCSR